MFPFFSVFGRNIGLYGLCAVVGLIVCGFVAYRLGKKHLICSEDIVLMVLTAAAGIIIGGSLLFGFTHFDDIAQLFLHIGEYTLKDFISKLVSCFSGMVYYGGFVAAVFFVYLFAKKNKDIDTIVAVDLLCVCIPLFHGFGRIGCFLGGCCYGIECAFGFTAHNNPLVPQINDVSRFPVQLVESACNFLIFFVLCWMFRNEKAKGKLLYIYLLIYPVIRFILEFFRGDEVRGFLFGLSTSQVISVVLFVYAAVSYTLSNRRNSANT